MTTTLADLRRFAVTRSLFPPTTLARAVKRLGFVQADPIRAPARAQDLTLRHRVRNYHAGDLERCYETIDVEEDVLVNYGFVPREVQALMQPRGLVSRWSGSRRKRAGTLLAFVRERGEVHPREVEAHFGHGTVVNYWGGSSNATTHLLEAMHYAGLLRVVRREAGIRIYASRDVPALPRGGRDRVSRIDALVDLVVRTYAPLPLSGLSMLVRRLRYAVPQWRGELSRALSRAQARLAQLRVDGTDWYWPEAEAPGGDATSERVHFLAPFDPIVWDRRRFELLWGWPYRFEAYTPPAKRTLGYYALPLLWRDHVVGWANVVSKGDALEPSFGFIGGRAPSDIAFNRELEAEVERFRAFLRPASARSTRVR